MPAIVPDRGPARGFVRDLPMIEAPPTPPLCDRIVTAAEAVCLREGAARMTMRKVAGEVGVSAAAIYRHFENKQALLNEIVVGGLHSLGTYLRPALEAETPYMRLRQLCERFLDFALEQPEHFDLAFLNPDTDREQITHWIDALDRL